MVPPYAGPTEGPTFTLVLRAVPPHVGPTDGPILTHLGVPVNELLEVVVLGQDRLGNDVVKFDRYGRDERSLVGPGQPRQFCGFLKVLVQQRRIMSSL